MKELIQQYRKFMHNSYLQSDGGFGKSVVVNNINPSTPYSTDLQGFMQYLIDNGFDK